MSLQHARHPVPQAPYLQATNRRTMSTKVLFNILCAPVGTLLPWGNSQAINKIHPNQITYFCILKLIEVLKQKRFWSIRWLMRWVILKIKLGCKPAVYHIYPFTKLTILRRSWFTCLLIEAAQRRYCGVCSRHRRLTMTSWHPEDEAAGTWEADLLSL